MANTKIPVELSSTPGIVDNSNATAITIDSSENVGIGAISPNATLHVATASSKVAEFERTGVSVFDLTIGDVGDGASQLWFNAQTNDTGFNFRPKSSGGTTTNALLIDPDGNVGIGTTSPSYRLHTSGSDAIQAWFQSTHADTCQIQLSTATTNSYARITNNAGTLLYESDVTADNANSGHQFKVDGSERIRIDSSGRLLSGTTSPIEIGRLGILFNGGNSVGIDLKTTSADGYLQRFFDSGGTNQGNIYLATNGTVSFNNLSDYRVKENVVTDWDATTRLKQLKPSRFNFIADSTNTTVDGFLAHEVEDIVPEAITGTKDATEELTNVVINSIGNVIARDIEEDEWTAGKENETYPSDSTWAASHTANVYQGIDQAKLVPLLTKALQEQQTIIEDLQARIETLENA